MSYSSSLAHNALRCQKDATLEPLKACLHWQQIVAENGNKLLPEFVAENGNKLARSRRLHAAIVNTIVAHKLQKALLMSWRAILFLPFLLELI